MSIDLLGPASAPGAVTERPGETREFAAVDTWFKECSSPNNPDGTYLQAVFMNAWLAQVRYALRASGIDLDNADDAMLWKAMQAASSGVAYGVATGSLTALSVDETSPSLRLPLEDGAVALVYLPPGLAAGTGATIRFGGVGGVRVPLLRNDGSPVQINDCPADTQVLMMYRSGAWRLLGLGRAETPLILVTPTLYVSTTGDDSRDGRSPATALRTIDAAYRRATLLYLFGRALTIQVLPGTHTLPSSPPTLAGSIILRGEPTNPASTLLIGTVNADDFDLKVTGVTIRNPTTDRFTASVSAGGRLTLEFADVTSTSPLAVAHIYNSASFLTISNGVRWLSSAASMIGQRSGNSEILTGSQLAVGSGLTWSDAAFSGTDNGVLVARGSVSIAGSSTGVRYRVDEGFRARTFGLGPNLFPGNQAGIESNGARYIP